RVSIANGSYGAYLDGLQAYYAAIGADRLGQFRQDVPPMTDTADSGFNQGRQLAVLNGYWSISSTSHLEKDPSWQFASTWAPTFTGNHTVQRLGGRLAAIPANAKNPATGWDIIRFLASDSASSIFLE